MLTAGDTLSLAVEKPAAGGAMIARHDGRIVLVTGAIPGERVRARIVRVAKGLVHAATVDVLESRPRIGANRRAIRSAAAASTHTSRTRGSSRSNLS